MTSKVLHCSNTTPEYHLTELGIQHTEMAVTHSINTRPKKYIASVGHMGTMCEAILAIPLSDMCGILPNSASTVSLILHFTLLEIFIFYNQSNQSPSTTLIYG